MTLKPSKTKQQNMKKNKKKKKKKKNKKNQKILKNELFSYQSKFSSFLGGCPKFPFFNNLAQKARTLKHYKNRCFSKLFFEKNICVTKRPFLDQKNLNSEIPVIVFFACFLLFQQQKTPNIAETPIFIVFSEPKTGEFSNFKLKTLKIEKPNFCTLFLKKAIFRNCQIIGHKKNTK